MATAPAASAAPAGYTPSADRPNAVSVGVIIWLSSELMFFAALFAMYFSIRSLHPEMWAAETEKLALPFASFNTFILVMSSVTCQMGVFAAEKGNVKGLRRWFVITFIMGAYFVGGQVAEYSLLVHEGVTLQANGFGSMFYLTTGFHGLHVTGGLIAFLLVLGRTYASRRFTHRQATTAIVVSYYWHFVDVVWIGLFFAIYGLR